MTVNRVIETDRANTVRLLDRISRGAHVATGDESWLGHTGGAGQVDFELLWGTTMTRMLVHRPSSVEEHLDHLEQEHGIKAQQQNEIYRLVVPPLAQ